MPTEGRTSSFDWNRRDARRPHRDAVPSNGAIGAREREGTAPRVGGSAAPARRAVFRQGSQAAPSGHTMSLPPPRLQPDLHRTKDVSRVVSRSLTIEGCQPRQGAKWPRRANPHFPFINYPLSITDTTKSYRLDWNPATGSFRTGTFRNLPSAPGFAHLPRPGDGSGNSLSAEVRQASARWTHTCFRSSCRTPCRAAGERFVPAVTPVDRHHEPPTTCVRGARIGRSGPAPFGTAALRGAEPRPETTRGCFCLARLTGRPPARTRSATPCTHLHRERPLR
jgi:hypothetical protein